ncbi:MAG: phosphotransferase family protein [Candidatus Promineifilaceae bacterium]|nr:phosphotransferase family protein [Candidatus Promineifilaceae bacterium]
MQAEIKQRLSYFLRHKIGEDVAVERLRPLAGGASRETWHFEIEIQGDPFSLVMRLDTATTMHEEALSREEEFRLLQVVYSAGIPSPRPYWLCVDSAVLGAPFFLMGFVPGESIGPRVVRRPELASARRALPVQMARELARIHALNPDRPEIATLPRPVADLSPAQHTIRTLRRALERLDLHSPGLTAGLRWLEQNQPPAPALRLVHGDFRIGNLIVGREGLSAVIDWEFAHLGDPVEDVAWPLVRDWRFGRDHLRLGGIADAEPFLTAYEEERQQPLDRTAVAYWEIMGNMKWAVTCLVQAERHLSGEDPSIELASLGRRSAEMELELLNLIKRYEA